MVQALSHGQLPQTLHIDEPTDHVDWESGAVRLLTEAQEWPETGRPRRAAVSSFGISGTNAHVILEQAPATPPEPEPASAPAEDPGPVHWLISGRTPQAVREHADRLRAHLEDRPELPPAAVSHELSGRAQFDHRAAIVGTHRDELLAGLHALTHNNPHPTLTQGTALPGKTVFVFPGQGSQWHGMGTRLYHTHPTFKKTLNDCADALTPHTNWNLIDTLNNPDPHTLDPTHIIQPALWALMIALARTWQHHNIHPDAVIGHSQGEIAAAHIAGALTLDDSATIIALRSHTLTHHAPPGGMLSLNLTPHHTQQLLTHHPHLHIAAYNGPTNTVIAGTPQDLDTLQTHCTTHDIRHRRIPVTYASHTPHIETLKQHIHQQLAHITPTTPTIPFHSTLTGTQTTPDTPLNADYWYQNLRHPVLFHPTIQTLLNTGHTHYLETSPHPTLTPAIDETLHTHPTPTTTHTTLQRNNDTPTRLHHALAHTYTHGHTPTWPNTTTNTHTTHTNLPTYPFQHHHYWLNNPTTNNTAHDDAFWATLENTDPRQLATTLGLDAETLTTVIPALAAWRETTSARTTLSTWRYTVNWQPHDPPQPSGDLTGTTWVVLSPEVPPAELTSALEAADATVVHLADTAQLPATLDRHPDTAGILSLLSDTLDVLTLIQTHATTQAPVPLWHLTHNAVQTTPHDTPPHPDQAQTWGLARVAALEHPTQWGGLIDLPTNPQPHHYTQLTHHLTHAHTTHPNHEDQTALRNTPHHPRLTRTPHPTNTTPTTPWHPHHTTLITGGTGALGPHIARWLVGSGAEHLVLTSRRGAAAEGMPELVDELEAQGVRITVAACDVSDREDVAELVKSLDAAGHQVGTVIHAAALMQLNSLAALSVEEFRAVAAAKVAGARHLDELLAHHPVEAFVVFSSIAGVWGSGDHGAYAAANAYLDAFAARRRARGLPATSVAWGVWGSDKLPDAVDPDFLRRQGLPLIDPETAFAGLRQALDHDETFVAVADVDWARFLPVFASARPRPLLESIPEVAELLAAARAEDATSANEDGQLVERLAALPAEKRDAEVLSLVVSCLAVVLGRAGGEPDIAPKTAFKQLGVDSLLAVELRNRLGEVTGLRLPATLVFEYPTPLAVAGFLKGELLDAAVSPGVESVSWEGELDRLETMMTSREIAEPERAGVADRLRALLVRFDGAGTGGGGGDVLDLVSDEEMFDLIDKEFGDE
ncbi:hypothetical protein N566_17865 [Streptomycetaceae bacterium MP113-05]|nr:hypothetical protein N566_17865 [Streptomycetaceae bacterium MP113-05]